jgi:hypothetical protein
MCESPSMLEPVKLVRGWEYLTDEGAIKLLRQAKS